MHKSARAININVCVNIHTVAKLVSYKEKDMQEEAIALSTRRSTSRYGFFPLPALQRVRVTRTRWRQDVQSCFVTNDVSLPLSSRMLSYMTIYLV